MVLDIVIGSQLVLDIKDIRKKYPVILKTIQQLFTYKNPKYLDNEKWGYSNFDTPRRLFSYYIDENKMYISRGGLDKLLTQLSKFKVEINLIDRTFVTEPIDFSQSKTIVRPDQDKWVTELLAHNNGCAKAYTSFGKTVSSGEIIKRIQQRTTILVHTTFLQKQWIQELCADKLFNLSYDRVGGVGGLFSSKKDFHQVFPSSVKYKNRILNDVNVCLYQSLSKPNHLKFFEPQTGLLIFDEGQKSPIEGIQKAVNNFRGRYRYSVSAGFKRKDGKEFLTFDSFGPIRTIAREQSSDSKVLANIGFVKSSYSDPEATADGYTTMITRMAQDKTRNIQICRRLLYHMKRGKLCIVFVERKEQAGILYRMLSRFKVELLVGKVNKKNITTPKKIKGTNKYYRIHPEVQKILLNYDDIAAYDRIKELADKKEIQLIIATQKAEVGLSIRTLDYGLSTTPIGNNLERFNQVLGRLERTYSKEQEEFFEGKKPTPLLELMEDKHIKPSIRSKENIVKVYSNRLIKRKIKRRKKK